MDGQRFDEIARAMVKDSSRRSLLKGVGGLFAIAIGLAGADEAAAAPSPKGCKSAGNKCKSNDSCCDGTCCGGRCQAPCPAGQTLNANCVCVPTEPGSACSEMQPCPDLGNPCWPDVCVGGSCTQVPLDCDDGNPCTDDVCIDGSGCQHSPKLAGTACPDNGFCDAQGACLPPCSSAAECPASDEPCLVAVCESGVCNLRPNPCDDGNPCTDGFCTFGVGCQYSPKPAIPCPGGFCDAQGTCLPPCSSADECPPPPPGEKCLVAVCESGVCNLRGKNCDTGNPCTDDSCVEGTGCVSNPGPQVGMPCPDNGICSKKGICVK